MKRRSFIKSTLAVAAGATLLRPFDALSAAEPLNAFAAQSETEVLRALFGHMRAMPSSAVKIEAPVQAMRGNAVDVKVWCELEGVEMIAIVTGNNRYPLNTYVSLLDADGYYRARLRMERTSTVTAYVRASGELYSASTHIKVTHGGFGMHF